jgi:protein phosphatase
MNYISAYCTDTGAIKRINQDSLCIKSAAMNGNEYILAAVCDGLGGLSDGETASAFVICTLSEWFEKRLPEMLKEEKNILQIRHDLDDTLHDASDRLNSYAERTGKTLGTTMTALIFLGNQGKIIAAHIGDSRAYMIKNGNAELLTTDHSVIFDEIRSGKLTEEEAAADTRQNQLTRCIGAGLEDVTFDYSILTAEYDTVYMICSDGFVKKITAGEIAAELDPDVITDDGTAERKLAHLTKLCIERDETDNISSLAIKLIERAEKQIAEQRYNS